MKKNETFILIHYKNEAQKFSPEKLYNSFPLSEKFSLITGCLGTLCRIDEVAWASCGEVSLVKRCAEVWRGEMVDR